jgi:GT2 family glycosyltransferase
MRVAAVIPHWNRGDLLSELLNTVARQTRPFDEVIVVDNGSTDNSAEVARQFGARFIELGRNLGFAPAVNRGIKETAADWIAILNNDVTLAPDWLDRLLNAAGEGISFATGKILSSVDPRMLDATFDELSRAGCAWRCGAGRPDSPVWNEPRRIRMAPMTAAIFRSDLFREVGLLDEAFESYLEDVDFGLRCSLLGRIGAYEPTAVVHHRGSATLGEWNRDTVRRISRNQVLLIQKHFQGQPKFNVLVGQLLWGLLAFRHARGLPYLLGKLEGLRGRREYTIDNKSFDSLGAILKSSEQAILDLQHKTGFDSYWRMYFCLSRR